MFPARRKAPDSSSNVSISGSDRTLGAGLTLRRHVQPREFNAARLADDSTTDVSSVFLGRRTAEIAISTATEAHASRIADWLKSWDSAYLIRVRADEQVGWVMRRGELFDLPALAVRVLLLKTDRLPTATGSTAQPWRRDMGTRHESGTGYPALSLYLLMYLEMLASEYGGMWGAARAFVHEEDVLSGQLPKDIRRVLKTTQTDDAVGSLFQKHLGTVIDPRIHGFTFREWLIELLQVVESEIDARRASAPSLR